jgi:hypothetical protein
VPLRALREDLLCFPPDSTKTGPLRENCIGSSTCPLQSFLQDEPRFQAQNIPTWHPNSPDLSISLPMQEKTRSSPPLNSEQRDSFSVFTTPPGFCSFPGPDRRFARFRFRLHVFFSFFLYFCFFWLVTYFCIRDKW